MACINLSSDEANEIREQLRIAGLKLSDASQLIHRNPNYVSAALSRKSIGQKEYLELLEILRKNKSVKKHSQASTKAIDKSESQNFLKDLINTFIEDQLTLLSDLENITKQF